MMVLEYNVSIRNTVRVVGSMQMVGMLLVCCPRWSRGCCDKLLYASMLCVFIELSFLYVNFYLGSNSEDVLLLMYSVLPCFSLCEFAYDLKSELLYFNQWLILLHLKCNQVCWVILFLKKNWFPSIILYSSRKPLQIIAKKFLCIL